MSPGDTKFLTDTSRHTNDAEAVTDDCFISASRYPGLQKLSFFPTTSILMTKTAMSDVANPQVELITDFIYNSS